MQFLSLCQSNKGDDRQIYSVLSNHQAVASDGILTLGHPIEEDLEACPHTANMILALKRCSDTFAITQHTESLQIVSGDFSAFVPCVDRSRLPNGKPDANGMTIDQRLTDCLELVTPLANDKGEHVLTASIKIQSGSAIATNREIIVEAWHGLNMPTIIIPKYAATSIIKCGKKLSGFGFNIDGLFPATDFQSSSVTFYFEDGAWLKTQLYKLHQWPEDVTKLLNDHPSSNMRPICAVFLDSVKKVLPFSPNGLIWCADTTVSSHNHYMENAGAKLTLEVSDAPKGRCYVGKNLLLMPDITHIDEVSNEHATLFWGNNIRGAVYHLYYDWTADEDEIPF